MTFRSHVARLLAVMALSMAATVATANPKMTHRVVVPDEFKNPTLSPNGDPDSVRYTNAYEAFWWNCVMVRANDLSARCPFICSGTPAATSGCADGAGNADEQIDALLKQFSAAKVQAYLRRLGANPRTQERLGGYFRDGPRADDVER